jgi:hypothetical protein
MGSTHIKGERVSYTPNRSIRVPPVLLSRRELESRGARFLPADAVSATTLPIEDNGATLSMAQDVRWLDNDYFAVGRWDGSIDVFRFNPQESLGPRIRTSASSPSSQGVQMITRLSSRAFVSSNGANSMIIWQSPTTDSWEAMHQAEELAYDPTFGAATGGDAFTLGSKRFLLVGHSEGYLTIWSNDADSTSMRFVTSVDLRSAHPVNPFGLQSIHDVYIAQRSGSTALALTGSENGEVCFVRVPDGGIVSRTVFNPSAQRGINSIAVRGRDLLVANCSVGSHDKNLWYFQMNFDKAAIEFKDSVDLKVNPKRPQAFNSSVVWGQFEGGACWFSSTEEGALWMGTVAGNNRLSLIGYHEVTSPLGSALAYNAAGRLVVVSFNLYEFTTLTTPAASTDGDPQRFPDDVTAY